MTLKQYFNKKEGVGVLSTSNLQGMVTSAIYSKPYVFDDNTIAFVMRKRLTYENLKQNPFACYLFLEVAEVYSGIRLFLKKIKEETDNPLIDALKRPYLTPERDEELRPKFLVYFKIEKILPLIGDGKVDIDI